MSMRRKDHLYEENKYSLASSTVLFSSVSSLAHLRQPLLLIQHKHTSKSCSGEKVTEPVYGIFLWSTQRGLERIMPNIWNMDIIEGELTPEELAKERALQSIAYYIAVIQKADELEIKLTKEEKNTIKEAAKQYIEADADFVNKIIQ